MSDQEYAGGEINIDLNEYDTYDGRERPLLPTGDYVLRVIAGEQTTGNGKPMIKVESEVVSPEEHAGAKVWNNYMLQSKDNTGLKRLKQFVIAVGGSLSPINTEQWIGVEYRASIVHADAAPRPTADGSVQPGKTFANVVGEMPLEVETVQEEAPAPPPVTKAKGGKAPAARRA